LIDDLNLQASVGSLEELESEEDVPGGGGDRDFRDHDADGPVQQCPEEKVDKFKVSQFNVCKCLSKIFPTLRLGGRNWLRRFQFEES